MKSWMLTFSYVLEDVSGGNIKTKQGEYLTSGKYPIVDQGQDLIGGYSDDEEVLCRVELPAIIFGDHTRIVKYVDFPFGMGADGVKVLRPKLEADVKYLYYYLQALHIPNTGYNRHFKYLKRSEIYFPPLPEQRRIAAILDAADALRAKRRAALAKLDALLGAVFLEMFGDPVRNERGWEVVELGEVTDITSGVTKGQRFNGKATVFVPYMRVANVQDGHIVLDEVKTIEALETDAKKYQLQVGDILLTEGGDPDKLGRGAIWKGEISNCIHQNHIFRVRLTIDQIIPEYLSALIGSQRGKRYFLRAAKQTTGIATINKTQLTRFPALLPPKEIQVKFKDIITQLEAMKERQLTALREHQHLFDAIQQRAFRGEL